MIITHDQFYRNSIPRGKFENQTRIQPVKEKTTQTRLHPSNSPRSVQQARISIGALPRYDPELILGAPGSLQPSTL